MDVFALATRIESTGGQQVMRELEAVDRVGRRTSQGLGTVSSSTRTLSSSFGGMSAVLQDVARDFAITGSVGTREFKQLAREGTELALLMGAGGPVVAAVGLVGLTIATTFSRAADEAAKARVKIANEFDELVKSTRLTDIQARTTAELEKRVRLTAELQEREELLAETPLTAQQSMLEAGKGIVRQNDERVRQEREIERVRAELAVTEVNITQLQARQNELAYDTAAVDRIQAAEKARIAGLEERRRKELEIIADLERQLSSLEDVRPRLADTFNLSQIALDIEKRGITIRVPIEPVLPEGNEFQLELIERVGADLDRMFAELPMNLGTTFLESLGAAWGGGMDAAGDVLLSSLGRIASEMGKSLLVMGLAMEGLLPALTNPFTSGAAMIVAGGILTALGAALSGALMGRGGAGGGGGYGRGIGRQGDISRFTLGSPTASTTSANVQAASKLQPMQPVHFTVIGAHDKKAQRDVTELLRMAALRGLKPA